MMFLVRILYTAAGNYTVSLTVTDANGETDTRTETDFVKVTAGNRAPVLDPIADQTVVEGQPLIFSVTATDPDATTPLLSAFNLPPGAAFTDNRNGSGVFSWTPQVGDAAGSPYSVTFTATDATDPTLEDNQTISVTAEAAPPFRQETGGQSLVSMEAEHYHNSVVGPDGHEWLPVSESGSSGTGVMQALPEDTLKFTSDYANLSPRLDYQVNFTAAGIHYIWVRGFAPLRTSDSLHIGLNGQALPSANKITNGCAASRSLKSRPRPYLSSIL